MLCADETAHVSELAHIDESTRGSQIRVGPNSVIDSFVRIKCAGGTGDVSFGKRCYVNSGTVIYSGNGLQVGDDVLIAANCTIAPVNHAYKSRDIPIIDQRFDEGKGGIVIEDDVWIGANSVIVDGTIIRRGAVVGASSLVRGELKSYGIYGGNPLRLLGERQ
jgi:virginiamycin A acetyltransferase